MGRPPLMKDPRAFSVNLPAALLRQVNAYARRNRQSRNAAVRELLESALAKDAAVRAAKKAEG